MEEEWRKTVGGYLISNTGLIINPSREDKSGHLRTAKIIKPYITKHGYVRINLYIDGKRKNFFVHRLVAEAFVSGYKDGLTVNHKDGNKLNNNYTNLEWVTSGDNQRHAYRTGLKRHILNGCLSKKVLQFTKSGEFVKEYPSSKEAERQTGFDRTNICKVCRFEMNTAYGYVWRYETA